MADQPPQQPTPPANRLPGGHDACNVMLTAAGRRVALMRLLEQSIAALPRTGGVLAMDVTPDSAAMRLASATALVPPYRDPACLDVLLDLCRAHALRLIVPTIDPELPFYAQHAQRFAAAGCAINISSPETIEIGRDKQRTHAWLAANDLPTVAQAPYEAAAAALSSAALTFPIVIKPRYGSSSVGVSVARNPAQFAARAGEQDLIVQSIARGREYTVDVFVDRAGRCRCAVPRLRMETRSGEVSKGITVRQPAVAELARRVAETLPGAYGVLNVQIFHDVPSGESAVIELNPRFGGGYPLAHEAGAPMTLWLLQDALGLPNEARDDGWRGGLTMLRYDEAVFVQARETQGL